MKRILRLVLVFTLTLSFSIPLSSITASASNDPFSGGDGTAANPYIIETIDQLEAVQFYRDKCFVLNNDLTFDASLFEEGGEYYNNGKGWTPIGKSYSEPFSGTFDGNGKTIKGLRTQSDQMAIGLFGYSSGIVKNLNMEEVYICGDNASESYANCGGIIGYLTNGKLINCKVKSGSVQSNSDGCCGGLVGCLNHNGSVVCSVNKSSVSSSYEAGGITGTVGGNGGSIRECFNEGEINGGSAGGITGGMYGLTLNDCYNAGNVTGSDYAGGINGGAGNYSYLTNFLNTGVILGSNNVGSVSGNKYSCESSGCYSTANYKQGSYSMDGELISPETINQQESYQGFDFESIWVISSEGPKLRNINNVIIEHKLTKYPAVEATCTTKGNNEYYICDYCGVVFKADKTTITTVSDEIIPAKGHQLIKHDEVAPTCTTDGNYEYYTCANCDIAYKADGVTETRPKFEVWKSTGHSWNEEYTVDKEASCIEEGSKSIHCSVCNAIDDTTVTVIPKSDHTYGDWNVTKEATCTEDGSKEKVCSVCEDKVTEVIPATGHSFSEEFITDTPASCTTDGSKSRHCAHCDEITDVTVIPATGHTFGEWVEVTPSTCENEGLRQHTCEVCGTVESENLDPKGHDFEDDYTIDVPATCTTDGSKSKHCKNCDAVTDSEVIPASGHSFGGWNVTKEATCLETGLKERSCSVCGDKETESIPLTDHNWQTNPTVDNAATCTEDGLQSIHCSVCGVKDESTVTVIPKTGHDWNEPIYTWKDDNSSVTASRSCRNDSSHKESETVNTTSEVTKAPTYTEKGETTYTAEFTNEVFTKQTKTVADIPVLERVSIEKATVSNVVAKVYTGKALTQTPTIKVGTKTLKSGTDYKLTYKNNKNVGKATVTITGIGAYKGTISKTFNINPKPTTLSSVKAAKKGFTAKWKKQATQTTGYQIQYALDSKFTSGQKTVTISKNTTLSKKVTKLKAKKKYYVRVRTYKTVNGVKYYSSWSKVKTVTTKK